MSVKTKIILSLIGAIFLGIIIFSIVLNVKNCQHQQEVENLQRQILEQTGYAVKKVDENTSAIQTLETQKSISRNDVADEIAKQIKKNKLDIVYDAQIKGQVKLEEQLKGKSNKPTTIVKHEKEKEIVVTDPEVVQQCKTCLAQTRIKVPFDVTQGPFHVVGHTLTPNILGDPGDYQIDVSVVKDLELEITLAQGKKGHWKTFIYSEDFDASHIKSKISVKPFQEKWYHKFSFPLVITMSNKLDVNLMTGAYYKFIKYVSFGIQGGIMFMQNIPGSENAYRWHLGVGAVFHTGA